MVPCGRRETSDRSCVPYRQGGSVLHAVLVGINRYRDPDIRGLRCARPDAEEFARLLEERIHPSERQVWVLLDEEETKRNLMIAVGEEVRRAASPEDMVVLYFAGHGSPETTAGPDEASRYLVAHDTECAHVYATGIDMERELRRWFELIVGPRVVLLFVDACFSGRAGGRTFEGPQLFRARTDLRGG